MPNDIHRRQDAENDDSMSEDTPIPKASDDQVLEETVRLAREGRRELESDPREHKPESE